MAREEMIRKVCEIICECGDLREPVEMNVSLYRYGIDSIAVVNIAYELSLMIKRDVPAAILVEHDTIEEIVEYLFTKG